MESFIDYCKKHIEDNIEDFVGRNYYGCDFTHEITTSINWDGTCTYSRVKALDYLHEWAAEASDYFNYHVDNFGKPLNPFENPEAFMTCMVIEGCSALLSKTSVITEHWNDVFKLNEGSIKTILKEIEETKVINF